MLVFFKDCFSKEGLMPEFSTEWRHIEKFGFDRLLKDLGEA